MCKPILAIKNTADIILKINLLQRGSSKKEELGISEKTLIRAGLKSEHIKKCVNPKCFCRTADNSQIRIGLVKTNLMQSIEKFPKLSSLLIKMGNLYQQQGLFAKSAKLYIKAKASKYIGLLESYEIIQCERKLTKNFLGSSQANLKLHLIMDYEKQVQEISLLLQQSLNKREFM